MSTAEDDPRLPTPPEAIHTAARRYCIERIAYWHARYAELGPPDHRDYSAAHKNVFPRYHVLEAILVEVERLRPEQFEYLQVARNRLWSAGQSAASMFTAAHDDAVKARALQEERDLFSAFVGELPEGDLAAVDPLPYRRTLEARESQALWARLCDRYGVRERESWYPLDGAAPPDTVYYEWEAFEKRIRLSCLRQLLQSRGIERVWELREFGPEYEIDVALFEPIYNGSEGFWTAEDGDWLIYASHESTITVSGGWLLAWVRDRM